MIPYFERFVARFPTIEKLADASEHDLLQAWSGLGYYSRARNLQRAAIGMKGTFPADYDSIRALPGVGDYTAAAVASIAFGLPHAAIDGNVIRVISRLTNSMENIAEEAEARLDPSRPGDFNEAMMELGATICLPKNPQCLLCPVNTMCAARAAGTQNELPVRKRAEKFRRERTLLAIRRDNEMLFRKRPDSDRKLAGFWELPEHEELPDAVLGRRLGRFKHTITNVHNIFTLIEAEIASKPIGYSWISFSNPVEYLFSTTVRKALRFVSNGNGV